MDCLKQLNNRGSKAHAKMRELFSTNTSKTVANITYK